MISVSPFKEIADKAIELADKVLEEPFLRAEEQAKFPTSGGVYIISENAIPIYVGKARNVRRRILNDHCSAEQRDSMSAFRRSLSARDGLPFGAEMRLWILKNCMFRFIQIEDAEMRSLVESLLIKGLKTTHLLNK